MSYLITKQPNEKYPVTIDFANWLTVGETISMKNVSAIDLATGQDATSSVIESSAIDGTQVRILCKAGTDRHDYEVTVRITTSAGNIYEEEVTMRVTEESGESGGLLCTREQVKDATGITGTDYDANVDELIAAATNAIMLKYGREFMPQSSALTRTFRARNRLIDLAPYDLRSVTSVILHPEDSAPETLVASTSYVLLPLDGDRMTSTYLQLRIADDIGLDSDFVARFGFAQVQITGNWGVWANTKDVAADVNRAAVETVLSWLDRPTARIAGIEQLGEPREVVAPAMSTWAIPASANAKLRLYSRYAIGVY